MARWQVTITGKGIRKAGIEKLAEKLKAEYGEGASVAVVDASPPESRSDRFQAALDKADEAKSEVESLKEELEEWKDNLPENLQDGEKAGELEEAIGELETVIDQLDEVVGASVSFPAMM